MVFRPLRSEIFGRLMVLRHWNKKPSSLSSKVLILGFGGHPRFIRGSSLLLGMFHPGHRFPLKSLLVVQLIKESSDSKDDYNRPEDHITRRKMSVSETKNKGRNE